MATSLRSLRLVYAVTFSQFAATGMFFAAIQLFVEDELVASKASVGLAVGAFSITAVLVRPAVGRRSPPRSSTTSASPRSGSSPPGVGPSA